MVVAMGLTLIFGGVVEARAQSRVLIQQLDTANKSSSIGTQKSGVTGVVVDTSKEPIINASVSALMNGRLINGIITDVEGRYSIELPSGQYKLQVRYLGYETEVVDVVVSDGVTKTDFVMKQSSEDLSVLGGPIVRTVDRRTFNRNHRALKREERKARKKKSNE